MESLSVKDYITKTILLPSGTAEDSMESLLPLSLTILRIMDAQLLNVGILFGGKSAEHEISIQSAKNIVDALDKNKYRPVLLYIDQKGHWHRINKALLDATPGGKSIDTVSAETSIILEPQSNGIISSPQNEGLAVELDVVFPILHGPMGEDGTVQGLLKLANVPFVGAGVLGSAVGMDKDVMKRLLKEADIPIGKFVCVKNTEPMPEFEWIKDRLGMPCYVKPANLGSSVGISKVATEEEFKKALELAFRFDQALIATHIRIVSHDGHTNFERKLTNVCAVSNAIIKLQCHDIRQLVVFSWEHPPTQTRAFRPMTKEEIKKAVGVGCDIYVGRRDPNTKTILTDQEEYICSGRTDRT